MNIKPNAKRVLCFGDSNTRGFVPGSMGKKRYSANVRWTGILQSNLGDDFEVIEEGLDARTTAYDDPRPEYPLRSGVQLLHIILDTHKPLDWVVLMLGTTDLKEMLDKTPEEITLGLENNIKLIKEFDFGEKTKTPKILILTPPIVKEDAQFAFQFFKGGTEKGIALPPLYKNLAEKHSCEFLDLSDVQDVDDKEGVHLTKESHKKMGGLISEFITGH